MIKFIYFQISFIAVYGDLLKRFVSADSALFLLYFWSALILIQIFFVREKYARGEKNYKQLFWPVALCMGAYVVQFLMSPLIAPDVPMKYGLSSMLYLVLPLIFILVFNYTDSRFRLAEFIGIFMLWMLPVNIVGIIQYAVNPDFLISRGYVETGGIVMRNYHAGVFSRMPSIYVSADRYSALALLQAVFALVWIFISLKKNTRKSFFWGGINFIFGIFAMLIAGARSRILLLICILTVLVLFVLKSNRSFSLIKKMFQSAVILFILLWGISYMFPEQFSVLAERFKKVEVVDFLVQSWKEKDIQARVKLGFEKSAINDEVTLVGSGLGSVGLGKPPEFGVRGLWAEGGIIFGGATLITFIWMLFVIAIFAWNMFLKNEGAYFIVFTGAFSIIGMGLLTGLTSAFEISSGIALCSSIGLAVNDLKSKKEQARKQIRVKAPAPLG